MSEYERGSVDGDEDDDQVVSHAHSPTMPQSAFTDPSDPTLSTRLDGPQTGVKGIKADARRQSAISQELHRLQIEGTNRRLESRSFQAETVHEEAVRRIREAEREDDDESEPQPGSKLHDLDDEEFERKWRSRRLQELGMGSREKPERSDDEDVIQKHRLREIDATGFMLEIEKPGYTAILLYEPDLVRCHPFLQAFLDLSSHSSSTGTTYLKARATSLSFSLLPTEPDRNPKADPDVLPSVLLYRAGELQESFIRVDMEVDDIGQGDLAVKLKALFRRKGMPTG